MKDKGQALIEFILILPILILILVSLIDIGNIFLQKYSLNNSLETAVLLYQNDKEKELKAYVAKENLKYIEDKNGDMVTITLEKNIKINAPGLSNVLGKNYKANATKTFYLNTKEDKNE